MCARHRFVSTLVLLLALGGQVTAADKRIPFQAADSGRFFVNPTGDKDVVLTQDFANGQSLPLLGNYKLVAHELVNLTTFEITGGAYTITAENGDTIRGGYSGTAVATQTDGVITYLVTGPITRGTGRFAGAAGTLTFNGVADLRTGVLSEIVTGEVSLRGSRGER